MFLGADPEGALGYAGLAGNSREAQAAALAGLGMTGGVAAASPYLRHRLSMTAMGPGAEPTLLQPRFAWNVEDRRSNFPVERGVPFDWDRNRMRQLLFDQAGATYQAAPADIYTLPASHLASEQSRQRTAQEAERNQLAQTVLGLDKPPIFSAPDPALVDWLDEASEPRREGPGLWAFDRTRPPLPRR
jgi:hypothetical protein